MLFGASVWFIQAVGCGGKKADEPPAGNPNDSMIDDSSGSYDDEGSGTPSSSSGKKPGGTGGASTGSSTTGSSAKTSSSASGVGPTDCPGDTNDAGDSENKAKQMPKITDADADATVVEGVISGADDVDWYVYEGVDSFSVTSPSLTDPKRWFVEESTSGSIASFRVCKYVKCEGAVEYDGSGGSSASGGEGGGETSTPTFNWNCPDGTEKDTSVEFGVSGCCTKSGNKEIQLVGGFSGAKQGLCTSTGFGDDSAAVYIKVENFDVPA